MHPLRNSKEDSRVSQGGFQKNLKWNFEGNPNEMSRESQKVNFKEVIKGIFNRISNETLEAMIRKSLKVKRNQRES